MNQNVPTNSRELDAFETTNAVSAQNKKLWQELWARGLYVVAVGQLHIGEIDYLIVTCQPPKAEPVQEFVGMPN